MSATATDMDRGVFYQRIAEPELSLALASLLTTEVPGSRPALLARCRLIPFVRTLKQVYLQVVKLFEEWGGVSWTPPAPGADLKG